MSGVSPRNSLIGSEKSVSSSEDDRCIRYAGDAVRRRLTSVGEDKSLIRDTSRTEALFKVDTGRNFRFFAIGIGSVDELCVRLICGSSTAFGRLEPPFSGRRGDPIWFAGIAMGPLPASVTDEGFGCVGLVCETVSTDVFDRG